MLKVSCSPCTLSDTTPMRRVGVVTPEQALVNAAEFLRVDYDAIVSSLRARECVNARFMASHYLRTRLGLSTVYLGRLMRRDHTTILHGLKKHRDYYETEPAYQAKYLDFVQMMEATCFELRPVEQRKVVHIPLPGPLQRVAW